MDVRCEKCQTEYDFEDSRVPAEGLSVKCSSCSHVFRVFKPGAAAGSEEQWMVRQKNGNLVRFKEMTTLQRWIVERKVSRQDEISKTGKSWKRLGDIPELAPFFQAVHSAAPAPTPVVGAPQGGARWENAPQSFPNVQSGSWQLGTPSVDTPAPRRRRSSGSFDDEDVRPRKKGGAGKWIALLLVFVVAGGAGGVYVLRPDLIDRLFGQRDNPLAQQHLQTAHTELLRDTYAGLDRARDNYEKALALDATLLAAKVGLAQVELFTAEYQAEEAEALAKKLQQAPAAEQDAIKTEIEKRRASFAQKVERAFSLGKDALTAAPDDPAANRVLADYYRIMKSPDTMKPLLERARQLAPKDALVSYVHGSTVAGDATLFERAIRYFDEALEAEPKLHRARYKLARVFLAQSNTQKALLHTETVLAAEPEHERAKALLAELRPPVAEPAPAPPEPTPEPKKEMSYGQLIKQADRLRQSDKPEAAARLYEKALEMDDTDPEAHTGLGWAYVDMEEPDAAVQAFKAALKLASRFTDAHMGLAEAYRMKGMKRDAIKHYRQYLDILPDGPEADVAKRMIEQLSQ